MAYRVAAVDVHKKMLAVVVADVAGEGEYQFERRKFGATPDQLHLLAQWLVQQEVEEVVMASTAQFRLARFLPGYLPQVTFMSGKMLRS